MIVIVFIRRWGNKLTRRRMRRVVAFRNSVCLSMKAVAITDNRCTRMNIGSVVIIGRRNIGTMISLLLMLLLLVVMIVLFLMLLLLLLLRIAIRRVLLPISMRWLLLLRTTTRGMIAIVLLLRIRRTCILILIHPG